MIKEFKENLFSLIGKDYSNTRGENSKILLAVSGGVDSMCMASLFYSCYYPNFANGPAKER